MKKIYLACIPALLLLFTACKKDKPIAPVENLLTSKNWELSDYQSPYYTNLSGYFEGTLSFKRSGRAEYTDKNGQVYTGTWEHYYHNDTEKHSLYIKVKNPLTQEERSEYYNHIEFLDDRHFTAFVYTSFYENRFQYQEKR
jgi:hypothetical protein